MWCGQFIGRSCHSSSSISDAAYIESRYRSQWPLTLYSSRRAMSGVLTCSYPWPRSSRRMNSSIWRRTVAPFGVRRGRPRPTISSEQGVRVRDLVTDQFPLDRLVQPLEEVHRLRPGDLLLHEGRRGLDDLAHARLDLQ